MIYPDKSGFQVSSNEPLNIKHQDITKTLDSLGEVKELSFVNNILGEYLWKASKFRLFDEELEIIKELRHLIALHNINNGNIKVIEKSKCEHEWIYNEENTHKYCKNNCDNYKIHEVEKEE